MAATGTALRARAAADRPLPLPLLLPMLLPLLLPLPLPPLLSGATATTGGPRGRLSARLGGTVSGRPY
jgi:hypothetical protein